MAKEDKPETTSPDNGSPLPEVVQELSQVASNPKKSMAILVILVIIFLYLFYSFFLTNTGQSKKTELPVPENVVKPLQVSDSDIPTIPALPTLPNLEDTLPPILPPAATTPPAVETPSAETKPVSTALASSFLTSK